MIDALRLGFGGARLPMLLQTEGAECGLACLAMVASYHGLQTDLQSLRRKFSLSLKGATMVDMVRMRCAPRWSISTSSPRPACCTGTSITSWC